MLDDTAVVVERTYDYYDTYEGIKIADSFIGASVDCEGIKNICDERKTVTSAGECLEQRGRSNSLISEAEAIEIAHSEYACCENFNLINVSLAYAPTENGVHVLCYEVQTSHNFCYVDVQTGDIIRFA